MLILKSTFNPMFKKQNKAEEFFVSVKLDLGQKL